MIPFERISLGTGALTCVRCGAVDRASERSHEEVLAEVSSACERSEEPTGPNIALEVTRPAGWDRVRECVSAAVACGARRVRVDGSFDTLGRDADASALVQAGVTGVRVPLLGSPVVHDSLAGGRERFEGGADGLKRLVAASASVGRELDVSVRLEACAHNGQDLPSAVAAAAQLGAATVVLAAADPELAIAAVAPWALAACDTGTVNSVWVELEGIPYCHAPGHGLHVASTLRPSAGSKASSCASCPLDPWCAGAAEGASDGVLDELARPQNAAALGEAVSRARGAVAA